jgi:hypothetical protein
MNNRKYMIFNMLEVDKIDFSQVMETSADTLRKSVDNSKALVKYAGESMPSSVSSLLTKEGPYTIDEILVILATSEWTDEDLNDI